MLVIWATAGVVLGVLVDVLLESQGFALPGQPWFPIIGMLILAAVLSRPAKHPLSIISPPENPPPDHST